LSWVQFAQFARFGKAESLRTVSPNCLLAFQ
jgi:hypothetical protein